MARRNATDATPDALLDALDYIQENTGLMGDDNPGKAHLSASGRTLMVMSDRHSFDHQSVFLSWLNEQDGLKLTNIGSKSTHEGRKAYVEIQTR